MRLCVLLLALSSCLAASASPALAAQACKQCDDTGMALCKRCQKLGCKGEIRCSLATSCPACGGTLRERCTKCTAQPEQTWEVQRTALARWLEKVREVDKFMGRELAHGESDHFVLTWGIEKPIDLPGGGQAHEAVHTYLARLEVLHERFRADLGAKERDFSSKTRVLLWGKPADQEKASTNYTGQSSTTGSKLMGAAPVSSIFYDKNHMHEEYELHQAVVHESTHCLLSNVFDGMWPGHIGGGWIDEGLAHYYETELFGNVRNYCYVESNSVRDFKGGEWEAPVRVAVDKGKAPAFLSVAGKNTGDMTPEQRMFAWSYCDWILKARPGSFGALARAVKRKTPVAEVLKSVLELSPTRLEAEWQAWVKEHYSLRPK